MAFSLFARAATRRSFSVARFPVRFSSLSVQSFSSVAIPARERLQQVLEDYREKHFGQTLFARFIKEMLVAADINHDGKISQSELSRLLQNIGAADALSAHDLLAEYGRVDESTRELLIDIVDIQDLILGSNQEPQAAA